MQRHESSAREPSFSDSKLLYIGVYVVCARETCASITGNSLLSVRRIINQAA